MALEVPEVNFLSLERARKVAPEEFGEAYDWILAHVDCAPFERPTKASGVAPELNFSLAAQQRGIHKPAKLDHALTVTFMKKSKYGDKIMENGDGTWVAYYHEQEEKDASASTAKIYNSALKKSMRDGIAVGVLEEVEERGLYRCRGLAFVVSYEEGFFTLYGPVEARQEFWSFSIDDFAEEEKGALLSLDENDERVFHAVLQARRVGQDRFRDGLMKAYESRCAMSGCDVVPALQAAHISSYLGPKSQVVSNGLLLRADLHLLYDRHLLSVDPEDMGVRLSPALKDSQYASLDCLQIGLPEKACDMPSEDRLAAHLHRFKAKNHLWT